METRVVAVQAATSTQINAQLLKNQARTAPQQFKTPIYSTPLAPSTLSCATPLSLYRPKPSFKRCFFQMESLDRSVATE